MQLYLNTHGIGIDLRAGCYGFRSETYTPEELAEIIWTEHPHVNVALYRVECRSVIAQLRDRAVAQVKGRLLTVGADCAEREGERQCEALSRRPLAQLHAWLNLLLPEGTQAADPTLFAYYETAIRQLIWQVKRRLRGERTYWEIMPVLISAQGTGKSSAVEKLGGPLDILFMADADFTLFEDKFRLRQLGRAYLVRLDEMGKASRTDMEAVKRTITQQEVQGRGMRSESERVIQRNASFIGTSNHSLSQLFHDSTGMRRFVEIRCRDDRYTEEWGKAIRAIDYNLLWQCESGLDERSPYQANEDLMRKFQETLTMPSDFEMFRNEWLCEMPGHKLPNKLAHDAFRKYCESIGSRCIRIQQFTGLMQQHYRCYKPQNVTTWCDIALNEAAIAEAAKPVG